ncbi:MAG TPA: NAD(P)H-hydrate dehydratase [Bryobacteraceae bacterium]|nr:NAD(P)H-hydrate dehydratase [Bryobacteraceae bacterium]
MKVLTAAQMREVDRRTSELGVPSIVLMENAGHRVAEFLASQYAPLADHRIVVFCGKGNNGGDGMVVARQLHTRFHPRALHVVLAGDPGELRGDAAQNFQMLNAVGCSVLREITPEMQNATIVIDALLGTGIHGPATGRSAELIRDINNGFALADVVAVDLPSGLDSDSGAVAGDAVHADRTVTFTAPKLCQVLSPACELVGELHVGPIGSPPDLYEKDSSIWLALSEPALFAHLFGKRAPESNKGTYGHVLVIAGGRGKTGAAAMAGIAALRAGTGLSTVASAASAITAIASHAPEIMTEPLAETGAGAISSRCIEDGSLHRILQGKNVVALGPGIGQDPETVELVRRAVTEIEQPTVVDADALNALAGHEWRSKAPRILTPHPGEMARLTGQTVAAIQQDRIASARAFATQRGVHLVLKGYRTVIAAPDGRVWINPTGSPAMASGGTGDVLTGLIAGLLAQFPDQIDAATLSAVWLHGRAGQLGAAELGEKPLIATDLFRFLPEAMREVADFSHRV